MPSLDSSESSPRPRSRTSTASWATEATDPNISGFVEDFSSLNFSDDSVLLHDATLLDEAAADARRKQHVLVTGGLGFIGSHTCVQLLRAGYSVIIVDDLSNSFRSALDGILTIARRHFQDVGDGANRCPKVEMHHISCRDEAAMRAVLERHSTGGCSDIIGVMHFAACKAVEESVRRPLRYYQNNVNGLVDMLALLDEFGIKTLVFSSSAAVYGPLCDDGRPLHEENCLHRCESTREPPVGKSLPQSACAAISNPYGRTKWIGEAILSDLVTSDPSWTVVVLRYFNPVGCDSSGLLAEDPRGLPSNLVPVVTQVLTQSRPELRIYGGDWDTPDGTAIRDFIHVSDLARGHTAALQACRAGRIQGGYRTYNLGAGAGHSVLEVVQAMETVTGRHIPRRTVARRAGDVAASVAAVDRARRELGWETRETLHDACRDICHRLKLLPRADPAIFQQQRVVAQGESP